MCTVVVLRRPADSWPLILAANRDEMRDRPWHPPGRHWPDRPEVVAGRDALAGGSWLGLNDQGVVAGVLNRYGSLGPQDGMRSRGELVLEALDHADAARAAEALADLNPGAYRSFNLVVADNRDAFWLRHLGPDGGANGAGGRIEVFPLPPGLSMLTARDRNDPSSPRIRANLARFEAAAPPDPDTGDWAAWADLMADRNAPSGEGPEAAMTVALDSGFGTVSSSLIAVPAVPESLEAEPRPPVWRFAPGAPDQAAYAPIDL